MAIRIIGGELGGRKLVTVPGVETRPTADRVRESIFNIIGASVRAARVLDLFAGTGALGIEALSRGAESAVFADNDKKALTALTQNIKMCSLEGRVNIIKWNLLKNLNFLSAFPPAFNLVFMDPPYDKDMIQSTVSNLDKSRCLEDGARVVIEHSDGELISLENQIFKVSDQRRYGKTLVSFFNYML